MAEGQSLLQIVENVVDKISDAISVMLIMVLDLQKTNKPVPPRLSKVGPSVPKMCTVLVQVARRLAADEYEPYPDLKAEIEEAADNVEQASTDFTTSLNTLQQSSYRATAWSGLVKASRAIADKTILLLRIVYGAEMRRLFMENQAAKDGVQSLEAPVTVSNADAQHAKDAAFSQEASRVATAAQQMGQHLRDKAKETTLPLQRDALLHNAKLLDAGAANLIQAANQVLTTDPAQRAQPMAAFDRAKAKLLSALSTALDPLEEEARSVALLADPSAAWADVDHTGDGVGPGQRARGVPAYRDQPLNRLLEAVVAGDMPAVASALRNIEDPVATTAVLGMAAADAHPSHAQGEDIRRAVDDMTKRAPPLRKAAEDAAQQAARHFGGKGGPRSSGVVKDVPKPLRHILQSIEALFNDLDGAREGVLAHVEPDAERVARLADAQCDGLRALASAVDAGEPGPATRAAKAVMANNKRLLPAVSGCASTMPVARRPQVATAMGDVTKGLGRNLQQLKVSLSAPDDAARQAAFVGTNGDLMQAVEAVAESVMSPAERLVWMADHQEADLDAGLLDMGSAMLRTALGARAERLWDFGRRHAEAQPKGSERSELERALDQLRRQKPALAKAMDQWETHPHDVEQAMEASRQAVQDTAAAGLTDPRDRVMYLGPALVRDLQAIATAPSPSHVAQLRDPGMASKRPKLTAAAREAARCMEANGVPAAHTSGIHKLADAVDQLMPALRKAARNADKSPDAAKSWGRLRPQVQRAIDTLVQQVGQPVHEISALANRALRHMDDALVAAGAGKTAAVRSEGSRVGAPVRELARVAAFAAKHHPSPITRQAVGAAARAMATALLPAYTSSVKQASAPAAASPHQALASGDRPLRAAVEALVAELCSPQAQLGALAQRVCADAELTTAHAQQGEPVAVVPLASQQVADAERLAKHARSLAGARDKSGCVPDPEHVDRVRRAVDVVEAANARHLAAVDAHLREAQAGGDPERPALRTVASELSAAHQGLVHAVGALVDAASLAPSQALLAHTNAGVRAQARAHEAARAGDEKKLAIAARAGTDAFDKAADAARQLAGAVPAVDPAVAHVAEGRRARVQQGADDLGTTARAVPATLQTLVASPEHVGTAVAGRVQRVGPHALAFDVAEAGDAVLQATATRLAQALDAALAAVEAGDAPAAAAAVEDAVARYLRVVPLAEADAERSDGARRGRMFNLLDRAERELPEVVDLVSHMFEVEPARDLSARLRTLRAMAGDLVSGHIQDWATAGMPKSKRAARHFHVSSPQYVLDHGLEAAVALKRTAAGSVAQFCMDFSGRKPGPSERVQMLHRTAAVRDRMERCLLRPPRSAVADLARRAAATAGAGSVAALQGGGSGSEAQRYLKRLATEHEQLAAHVQAVLRSVTDDVDQARVREAMATLSKAVPRHASAAAALQGKGDKPSLVAQFAEVTDEVQRALIVVADTLDAAPELDLLEAQRVVLDALTEVEAGAASGTALNRSDAGATQLQLVDPRLRRAMARVVSLLPVTQRATNAARAERIHGCMGAIPHLCTQLYGNAGAAKPQLAATVKQLRAELEALVADSRAAAIGRAQRVQRDLTRLDGAASRQSSRLLQPLHASIVEDVAALQREAKRAGPGAGVAGGELEGALQRLRAQPALVGTAVQTHAASPAGYATLRRVCTVAAVPATAVVASLQPTADNRLRALAQCVLGHLATMEQVALGEATDPSAPTTTEACASSVAPVNDKLAAVVRKLAAELPKPASRRLLADWKAYEGVARGLVPAAKAGKADTVLPQTTAQRQALLAVLAGASVSSHGNVDDRIGAARVAAEAALAAVEKEPTPEDGREAAEWATAVADLTLQKQRDQEASLGLQAWKAKVDGMRGWAQRQGGPKAWAPVEQSLANIRGMAGRQQRADAPKAKAAAPRAAPAASARRSSVKRPNFRVDVSALNPKGGTFADRLNDIAAALAGGNASGDFGDDPVLKWVLLIAQNLRELASAAEAHDAQGILTAGRSLATNINGLVAALRAMAAETPDRGVAQEMMCTASRMKNFGIQLKIMSSVKAANIDDSTGDGQLEALARTMGMSTMEIVNMVGVAKIKIYEGKRRQ